MKQLAIALAQSPIRAARAQGYGVIEVRALLTERAMPDGNGGSQQTWTRALRYELLTNGVPQVTGSYSDMLMASTHLRTPSGGPLDWQPVWSHERATPTTQQPTQAQEG